MRPVVSVILIRENAEQLTGSGCCGKLDGDLSVLNCPDVFEHARTHQRDLGVLHRAVRKFFPPRDGRELVSVVTVDPRNQLYLLSKLWRDVATYRPGLRSALRTGLELFALPAVVVNGRVLASGTSLEPDALCHEIARLLDAAGIRPPEPSVTA